MTFKNAIELRAAMVQDVISDPSSFNYGKYYWLMVDPPSTAIKASPRNSLLIKIIDDIKDNIKIAYPFFPSHTSWPVKPGECVWVFVHAGVFYWVCRKVSSDDIEDVCFTAFSREGTNTPPGKGESDRRADIDSGNHILPGFPDPDIEWLKQKGASYEKIMNFANASNVQFQIEPVPKFTKRPGDFTIQGSSNTLINLGADRGWKKDQGDIMSSPNWTSNATTDYPAGSGTIDIVTGRGRFLPIKWTTPSELGEPNPERTAPRLIETGQSSNPWRLELETDKNPLMNHNINPRGVEGDPDFAYDASRIYVSSKTAADTNFSLAYPPMIQLVDLDGKEQDLETAADGAPPPQQVVGKARQEAKDFAVIPPSPGIVIKSDEIRIVSRYFKAEDDFDVAKTVAAKAAKIYNGSIKIIKEGTRDEGTGHSTLDGFGQAIIALLADSTVFIDGGRIVLGTGREADTEGEGDHVIIGQGATEAMVLGHVLKTVLDDFFTALTTFLSSAYDTHTHPTGVGPSGPPLVIGDDAGCGDAKGATETFLSKVGRLK